MGLPEIKWRARTWGLNAFERGRTTLAEPQWRRNHLAGVLQADAIPSALLDALWAERWMDAHVLASEFLADAPQRFLLAPRVRAQLANRIRNDFPDAADDAAARADCILGGRYDLLGYRGLEFGPPERGPGGIDWHLDPVHGQRMPNAFWSSIEYLDPACGDHKIVWELNRHQHWIALARAFWLTGRSCYRRRFIDELTAWLASNPPLLGCNWASMLELGMRGLSWTWALNAFAAPDVADDTPWTVDLLLALDRQLAHVERNLSYYFSPNTHLLGEALALYVCGLALPFLRASTRRVEIGRRILIDEIGRQIAKDGSHRERSSHYHRYTLDFYAIALAIAEIAGDRAADPFRDAVERLSTAAAALADDGGRVPHFGDEDGGAAMPICWRAPDDVRGSLAVADVLLDRGTADAQEEALWLLSHPIFEARARRRIDGGVAVRSIALSEMGYFVSRSPGGVHVVMHAGPHGYMRGGHAHADALSITASLRDMPLLIDAGTGVYTADPKLREQFRSTKSHNTVTLDGRNQSHSDGPFHWKQRAVTSAMVWHAGDGFDYFEAAHDGYSPFEHRRHVMSIHDDLLIVMDLIAGGGSQPDSAHTAASHWHIDPRWSVRLAPGRATLSHDDARVDLVTQGGQIQHFAADAELGLGWHAPVYGRIEAGSTLRLAVTAHPPIWNLAVFSLQPDNEIASVDLLAMNGERIGAGERREGCGLRITRRRSTDYALVAEPLSGGQPQRIFEEIATDARMCFCRVVRGRVTRVSLLGGAQVTVDSSRSRRSNRPLEMVS